MWKKYAVNWVVSFEVITVIKYFKSDAIDTKMYVSADIKDIYNL